MDIETRTTSTITVYKYDKDYGYKSMRIWLPCTEKEIMLLRKMCVTLVEHTGNWNLAKTMLSKLTLMENDQLDYFIADAIRK